MARKPGKPRPKAITGVILSWMCQHCGWMNDNHFDRCSKCKTPYPEAADRPK